MINSLKNWLEAGASRFSSQRQKLDLFHEHAIYSEYWVQSELATLLPWKTGGLFLVDCGPALALPAGVNKYPDFSIRFASSAHDPLYFIELKDLITNSSTNAMKLRFETAVMARMDRIATSDRWSKYQGKVADCVPAMIEALESATIVFAGLTLGTRSDVPNQIPGFSTRTFNVDDKWALAFYELENPDVAMEEKISSSDSVELEVEAESQDITVSDVLQGLILKTANQCKQSGKQTALESPVTNAFEAKLLVSEIESLLASEVHNGKDQLRHVKPWVWRPESSGTAMTEAGREYDVEIRFSYHTKPVR